MEQHILMIQNGKIINEAEMYGEGWTTKEGHVVEGLKTGVEYYIYES